MKIIMFTTHCPQCSVLAKKLQQKNIAFEEIDDIHIINDAGITSVPMLLIDDNLLLDFKKSVEWINSLEV